MKNIPLRNNIRRFASWRAVVFFGLVSVLIGCKKNALIGPEVQPDGYLDSLTLVDTFSLEARTILLDPQGSTRFQNFAGRIQNDVFGKAEASLLMNFALESENIFLELPSSEYTVKELTLTVFPINAYGDLTDSLTLAIYQIEELMIIDSAYTSDRSFRLDDLPVGSETIAYASKEELAALYVLDPNDSNDVVFEGVKIALSKDLGSYLLQGIGTSYSTSSSFLDFFGGLAIVPQYADPSAKGALYNIDIASGSAGLQLKYSYVPEDNPDTVIYETLDYNVLSSNTRFNKFDLDYAGSAVEQAMASATQADKIYVQGMSGVKAKIEVPHIERFIEQTDAAIHRAQLVFQTDESQPEGLPYSNQLYLLDYEIDPASEDTIETLTLDFAYNQTRYGGVYDEANETYTFDVTRQLQKMIELQQRGEEIYLGFTLNAQVPVLNGNVRGQNVLKGSDNIALEVYYADISE